MLIKLFWCPCQVDGIRGNERYNAVAKALLNNQPVEFPLLNIDVKAYIIEFIFNKWKAKSDNVIFNSLR